VYELIDVSKHFSARGRVVAALEGVNLTIARGEFLAVRGPTGQGKTTLLTLLGALDRPTSGAVTYQDRNLATLSEVQLTELRAKSFGFIFQTFNLIPTLNAHENVQAALVPLRTSPSERHRRATEALESVGLSSRATHLPTELSGGQQQRVAIARALVKEPEVLLADEPTGNLDEETRSEIIGLMMNLWQERGLTLVVVTHDSTVARRATRVVHIRDGRLSVQGGSLVQR
jgi:putative ABC transport system ATP-binding protein